MPEENENQAQLTVEDLKKELPNQDYETLTLGEDTVAVRCLLKAKIAVKGMVQSTGHVYSEENEVCREATLKYALYEMFAFVGQENRAREKLEDGWLQIGPYKVPIYSFSEKGEGQRGLRLYTKSKPFPLVNVKGLAYASFAAE